MLTNTIHSVKIVVGAANKAEAMNVCAVGMGWAGGAEAKATLK